MYGRTPAQDLETRKKQAKALEMRLNGYGFDDIAAECGYNDRSAARKAYMAAMRGMISKENAAAMRARHSALLDRYRRALEPNLEAHEARSVEVLLKAMEHEAKLYGLYQEPKPGVAVVPIIREYQPGILDAVRGLLGEPAVVESAPHDAGQQ